MKKVVLYNRQGEVMSFTEVPPYSPLPAGPDLWGLEVDVFPTGECYVEGGQVIMAMDYDLSSLPLPCVVEIEEEFYPCTTQPEFNFDAPGTYLISVDAGHKYRRKEFEYEHTN